MFFQLSGLLGKYSLTSVLHTSLGESAQVCYSEVCVISEKDQMMKTKHGGTKYVRYSEGYTIVHVCDTEVKLYLFHIRKNVTINAIIIVDNVKKCK